MLNSKPFGQTCRYLEDSCGMNRDAAFTLSTRVYRGGGFTKDYVYLSGLRGLLQVYKATDTSSLYVGKGAISCMPLVNDLLDRGVINAPRRIPPALPMDVPQDPVIKYLLSALK